MPRPERYAQAVEIAAHDPDSDGLLVILTPQAMTDPTRTAEQLKPLAKSSGKPILASWMGGAGVAAGRAILHQAEIPTFDYPDAAVRAFLYMWRYSYNLRGLYETPALVVPDDSRIVAIGGRRNGAGCPFAPAARCSPSGNRNGCCRPMEFRRSTRGSPAAKKRPWPRPRPSAFRSC